MNRVFTVLVLTNGGQSVVEFKSDRFENIWSIVSALISVSPMWSPFQIGIAPETQRLGDGVFSHAGKKNMTWENGTKDVPSLKSLMLNYFESTMAPRQLTVVA